MTEYLVLIHGDESRWEALSADDRAEVDAAHGAFRDRAGSAMLASGELDASALAVTVRTGADGGPEVTDGPFAETKEVIGGFYLIEAPDREAAVALAATLAEARQGHGGVEVRPLVRHT